MDNIKNHYKLKCLFCGEEYDDSPNPFLLSCKKEHRPSLLRAEFSNKQFEIKKNYSGIFRFFDWLPIRRVFKSAEGPIVYQDKILGKYLGLENLFIIFNGYWPEKEAFMETCTFKELESPIICARMLEGIEKNIVIATAGNTGRAFLKTCSENSIPAKIVIPASALSFLWYTGDYNPCVKLITLEGDVDYSNAIQLGNMVSELENHFPEGGAKNVARRDGMGTAILTAIEKIGEIPDHYFQAVGSGTGGIATWEMVLRIKEDGRFGNKNLKLHLSQNKPFTIMTDAWQKGLPQIPEFDEEEAKKKIKASRSTVLSNRKPPYSITGGVYDVLKESFGYMYGVTNKEAINAGALFLKEEGCDLDPAAEVALASLIQAIEMGRIEKKDVIALNITGGGFKKLEKEGRIKYCKPDITFTIDELQPDIVAEKVLNG
jgi:cysteate synthase